LRRYQTAPTQTTEAETEARSSLLAFTAYTKPDYETNWHHETMCRYLDSFIAGDIKRLMIFAPPRHGKSEVVSRRLPAYIFGKKPDATIIAASYGADLARRMNRDVQRIMDEERYIRLFPDSRLFGQNVRTVAQGTWMRNSDMFEIVGRRGYYLSSGVGGSLTGSGAAYAIIDDPLKNRAQANSPTYRESIYEWYTSTLRTRLTPDGGVLLTCTRWHQDDLAGKLLALAASDPGADQWVVVRFPAIAEEPVADYDRRQADEALWATKFDAEKLNRTRISLGTYDWNSLYQQRPAPREGGMFKRSWFDIVGAAPKNAKRVRYWDKAGSTSKKSDFTAGVLMARDSDGIYYVEDVVHGQYSDLERERIIKQTAQLDGPSVAIWHEQEPGSGGKDSAAATTRMLAGYTVHAERVSGDKETRASPFAAQCEAHNAKLVRGDWNASYLEELTAFPNAAHDDRVDASSGAFNKLAVQITSLVDFADTEDEE